MHNTYPRHYLPTDTNGLADSVCKLSRGCVDCLAVDLVRPAAIIFQAAGYLGEIFIEGNRVGLAFEKIVSSAPNSLLARVQPWMDEHTVIPRLNRSEFFLVLLHQLT